VVDVMARGDPAATTESGNVAVAVCGDEAESLTVTPTVKLPLAAGVPDITPVVAPRLSPAGRLPPETDQVKGAVPPLICKVLE
jgi:hypothetical protein